MSLLLADFVAKVAKYQATIFSKENMAPRPSAKSPVSFSLGDEVPHIFIRESHQQPRKILISGGKRLLQQNLPITDSRPQRHRLRFGSFGHRKGEDGQCDPRG